MTTKKKKPETVEKPEKGEQLDLIDVAPENAKAIIRAARTYKKYQAVRLTALADEVKYKQKVLELIKAAKLKPLDGGKIKFEYDDVIITVTPQEMKLSIKDKVDEFEGE